MLYNKIDLEKENERFLQVLQQDTEKYLSFLETMAKFHKYGLVQQLGLHLHAPKTSTACATAEQWAKYFSRQICEGALAIPLLASKEGLPERMVYDISDTICPEGQSDALLWKYEEDMHAFLINDLIREDVPVQDKIIYFCQELADKMHVQSQLVADSSAYVVLKRLGYDPDPYLKELIQETELPSPITSILENTGNIARQVLNPIGKYIQNERRKQNANRHENTLLRDVVSHEGTISQGSTTAKIAGYDPKRRSGNLSEASGGRVQQQILGFSGADDGKGTDNRKPQNAQSNGVGAGRKQHTLQSNGNSAGGALPLEAISVPSKYNKKKAMFQTNVQAIQMLKVLEKENRAASPEEREILQAYVGFGGIAEAFDSKAAAWNDEYQTLKALLDDKEYRAARASVLNAHYTPKEIIQSIYTGLENLGFQGGTILEPSCGIGNFFAHLPDGILSNSQLYGVELDALSGRIAQKIYPEAQIRVEGFETTPYPDNTFDLAIGNVPFGDYQVNDPAYKNQRFLIHDYFLAKMVDKVRPGGVVAVITTKGTMDKKDKHVREYLACRAELMQAVRLPNTAFKAAGTDVTTDILLFKKRERTFELADTEAAWIESKAWTDGIDVNTYFHEHPEFILGTLEKTSTQYGFDITCKPNPENSLETQIVEAFSFLSRNYQQTAANTDIRIEENIPKEVVTPKPYSYFYQDGQLYFQYESESDVVELSGAQQQQIRACIRIRDAVRKIIDLQTDNSVYHDIQPAQAELNTVYEAYVAKYGYIQTDKTLKKIFEQDVSYPLLLSLEVFKDGIYIRKNDIFTKRTIHPYIVPNHADTPNDALAISIQEKGIVDLPYMESLMDIKQEDIIRQLEYKSIYFNTERKEYQLAEEYLSGDICAKIEALEQQTATLQRKISSPIQQEIDASVLSQELDRVQKNITALRSVRPVELSPSEIHVQLGANWLPPKDVEAFLFETLDTSFVVKRCIHVYYSKSTGSWSIEGKSADGENPKATVTFGTDAVNAYKLVEQSLNSREIKVYKTIYKDGEERRVIDKQATMLAQQKQELIKTAFTNWIWKEPNRRKRLAAYYNRHLNNIRPREYDGQYLAFPGMNAEISLRKHQKDAIAHTIYGGNTLLAHCVGAGKTYEMVASIMEAKRLKLCKKAMVVVPKHLTEQWGTEFLQLYPAANILVAKQKDFEKENRKEFCSKIATGEWDAIILGYTQFEKIPISKERRIMLLQEELDAVLEGIDEIKSANGERFTIKQMESQRKKLELHLEKLKEDHADQTLVFEELGVDRLYVDEAHYFKNLFTVTKMQNVAGVATTDAKKTMDLYQKCRYINEISYGRGIVFATGTPISNSMTELFTMQRYLQPERLKQAEVDFFDNWAADFGETITAVELSPEGQGFRSKTRFAKFHNLPELMSMFKEIADIKTADMLQLPVPKAEYVIDRIPPTQEQKDMVSALADRAETIRQGNVSPDEDNMLLITNEGRKLALDQRLINEHLPDDPNSKVNQCVRNVTAIWHETQAQHSTQMIFCDLSTPSAGFNVYTDIKEKLIAKGIPASEIAFIHDAKNERQKDILFGNVKKGQVRILLGSTAKMGTGTNVQDKLIALHDLDVPWRPSDLEQRSGRIVRQGNENKEVKIYRYVTEQTFDSYLWQIIENKQRFISQIMTSKSPVRTAEDVDEATLSYAEIKAIATGNPLIKEKMGIDIQLEKLKMAKAEYLLQKHRLEHRIVEEFPQKITEYQDKIERVQQDIKTFRQNTKTDKDGKPVFFLQLNGTEYTERKKAGEALWTVIKNQQYNESRCSYRGFPVHIRFDGCMQNYMLHVAGRLSYKMELGTDHYGNILRLENTLRGLDTKLKEHKERLDEAEQNFATAKKEVDVPFAQEDDFQKKILRSKELESILNADASTDTVRTTESQQRLQNLLDVYDYSGMDKTEKLYKRSIRQYLHIHGNKWADSFDKKVATQLCKHGHAVEKITDVLFKFSPTVPDKQDIQKSISEIESSLHKVAQCSR